MPDEELVLALAANPGEAFETLVLHWQQRVYAFALRLTASPLDAEEIAQDTFVRAWRALSQWPPERIRAMRMKAWLYQIALNVFRNRIAHRSLSVVPLEAPDGRPVIEPASDWRERPDIVAESAELGRKVATSLVALPAHMRVAVVLRYVEGFTYREIAELLEQPEGTVKAHVHRGTRQLRQTLQRERVEVEV
ncbi:MAG TPA: sigma-70 family RNA polymerase sigma factor [Ktedonobacterales bacterium]|nr:sigma-70 family RNA polymerase sigma factor [Ktedonobacterales bacterium]